MHTKIKISEVFFVLKRARIISLIIASFLIFIGGVFYFLQNNSGYSFEVLPKETEELILYPAHPLTGKKCENYNQRPYAIMFASDTITRPLSGISKADVVVEMPVVKDSITRTMALFACEEPQEIGSIRSSRHDFIPIAASFDAIYAHWGGSYLALEDLNKGIIDNIDALINPFNVFFRKDGILAPHDGFTSFEKLKNTAERLGYRQENIFEGYPRAERDLVPLREDEDNVPTTISIEYPAPYNLSYIYSKKINSYRRWRGNKPEIDVLNNQQVEIKTLVVMFTNSRQLDPDYNDVDVAGVGNALIFQNGNMQRVKWEKAENPISSKLKFVDDAGEEILFVSGNMWIHILDIGTGVMWGDEVL